MKKSSSTLAMVLLFLSFQAMADEPDRRLEMIAVAASASVTYADFVKQAPVSVEQRAALEEFLKERGNWNARLPRVTALPDATLAMAGMGEDALVMKFIMQPKAIMKIEDRVIVLQDRTPREIARDVEAVVRDVMFAKSALWRALLPPAFAFNFSDLITGPATYASTMPPLKGTLEPSKSDAVLVAEAQSRGQFKSFHCETIDGKKRIQIVKDDSVSPYFQIDAINGTHSFDISQRWQEFSTQKCVFQVRNGVVLLGKNPYGCDRKKAALNPVSDESKPSGKIKSSQVERTVQNLLLPGVPIESLVAGCTTDANFEKAVAAARGGKKERQASGAAPH